MTLARIGEDAWALGNSKQPRKEPLRFGSGADRDIARLAALVDSTAGTPGRGGGDVSLGFYLERPAFLSLALLTCAPNRTTPDPGCPLRRPGRGREGS